MYMYVYIYICMYVFSIDIVGKIREFSNYKLQKH